MTRKSELMRYITRIGKLEGELRTNYTIKKDVNTYAELIAVMQNMVNKLQGLILDTKEIMRKTKKQFNVKATSKRSSKKAVIDSDIADLERQIKSLKH